MIEFWYWWVAALVLLGLEVAVPGAVFLWMGVAAGVVGAVLAAVPSLAWQYQVIGFALLSLASVVVWRRYYRRHPIETDRPSLNQRGSSYVGRVFPLVEPIVDGWGRAKVGDGLWQVTGPELPAGARVRVTAVDGATLVVEPADEAQRGA